MLEDKISALLEQKFHCSQIMMKVGMEALELEEPNLVKAMSGLAAAITAGPSPGACVCSACSPGGAPRRRRPTRTWR